jgi:hypothetical protein
MQKRGFVRFERFESETGLTGAYECCWNSFEKLMNKMMLEFNF